MPSSRLPHRQRGASVFTMFFVAVIVGFFALMAMRAFPAVNEYLTIRRDIDKIAKDDPPSADAIRQAFERSSEVEYSISTIKPSDLEITPSGDHFRIRVKYDKEIEIFDPVYLLLKFDHSATSGGSAP